jgi:hypothetical protein
LNPLDQLETVDLVQMLGESRFLLDLSAVRRKRSADHVRFIGRVARSLQEACAHFVALESVVSPAVETRSLFANPDGPYPGLTVAWRVDANRSVILFGKSERGVVELDYRVSDLEFFVPGDIVEFHPTRAMASHEYPDPQALLALAGRRTRVERITEGGGQLGTDLMAGTYTANAFRLIERSNVAPDQIVRERESTPYGFSLVETLRS